MRAEGAPANNDLYKNLAFGIQGTGGSTAVANSYEQMRRAGATTRALLVAAAAQAWKVPASEISVRQGVVRHAKSSREATFGELAEAAARQTPPKDVKLKNPKDFTLIGKKLTRLDSPAKSTGRSSLARRRKLPPPTGTRFSFRRSRVQAPSHPPRPTKTGMKRLPPRLETASKAAKVRRLPLRQQEHHRKNSPAK